MGWDDFQRDLAAMKFSIRHLFALAVLAALAMVAWREQVETRREEIRLVQLVGQVQTLEQRVQTGHALQGLERRNLKEGKSLAAIRMRGEDQFNLLLKKYGGMEPVADDVVSLRQVPTLRSDLAREAISFRIWVPAKRPVWLKFGVQPGHANVHDSVALDQVTQWIGNASFPNSGPFQKRLAEGNHIVTIAVGDQEEGLPLLVELDDTPLLRFAAEADGAAAVGWSSTALPRQTNVQPSQPLPWLVSTNFALSDGRTLSETKTDSGGQDSGGPTHVRCTVWLSHQTSDFEEFPSQ
jgi:hypothetical protein